MSPFFSIVIPTFNSSSALLDALKSITGQSMKDFQLIIVDGQSADNTLQIVQNNVEDKAKLTVISEKDNGIYDAMNKGVKVAIGEWIYFLGSDDTLAHSRVLETLQDVLIAEPVDVLYGNIIRKSDKIKFGSEFDIVRLLTQHNIPHQAILYKREIFERLGYYNTNYKVWADWEFNIRCFRHTELRRKYINVEIAIYNNVNGLSATQEDLIFKKQLPKYYIKELHEIKYSKEYILGSRIYRSIKFLRRKK